MNLESWKFIACLAGVSIAVVTIPIIVVLRIEGKAIRAPLRAWGERGNRIEGRMEEKLK